MVVIIFFILLVGKVYKCFLVEWEEVVRLLWGVLLLFGGGFVLVEGFKIIGFVGWIGG